MENYMGLSLENFLKIFEYVKYTKKKWFMVEVTANTNNSTVNVYGTDDDFSSVTYIENINFDYINEQDRYSWTWKDNSDNKVIFEYKICFNKNEIIALLKEDGYGYMKNMNIYDQMGYSRLWVGRSVIADKLYKLARNASKLGKGRNPYNPYGETLFSDNEAKVIYCLDDMRQNEDIMNNLSMKAGEGMNMVNLDNHIITLYGSMYPITAKDKVSITLYDLEDGSNASVVRIVKNKPKDLNIVCVLRYRSLV